jgi:hypothetical protein
MIILKAIGGFFVKIWRWIKETAWVQPLLIVGAIFAIIFSIPQITKWANSASQTTAGEFYKKYRQSLDKEVLITGDDKIDQMKKSGTDADKLMVSLYNNTTLAYDGNNGDATKYASLDATAYGEKFFVFIASADCSGCTSLEKGAKELRDNWKELYTPNDGAEFKCYSIMTDQTSTNDDDFTDPYDNAFRRMLANIPEFFNDTQAYLETVPYYFNETPTEKNYENYGKPSILDKAFVTPVTLLVDYSKEAQTAKRAGVSEILFGGLDSKSNDQDKAAYLMQMWNHLESGTTEAYVNPFSSSYNH